MKGLLLKDAYIMLRKYIVSYMLILAAFTAAAFLSESNQFLTFYPCLLCAILPVSLLGEDELSHWLQYSLTLPCTREQIVSCKYITGIMIQIAVNIITGIATAVKMNLCGTFNLLNFISFISILFILTLLTSSIGLPLVFKLGMQKGRIAIWIIIAAALLGSQAASHFLYLYISLDLLQVPRIQPVLCLAAIGIYALSWHLSIVFYRKREF